MSDEKKIEPVSGAAPVAGPRPAERVAPAARVVPVERVEAVDGAPAVVAAIEARIRSGALDSPGALRALVSEVVARELGTLDADSRDRLVEDVAALLAEEPAWRARLDGLWRGSSR